MMVVARILVGLTGAFVVSATLGSAVRTVVLPRAVPAFIARRVFLGTRVLFRLRIGRRATYERIDRVMALYGPVSLLALLVAWLALVFIGFVGVFWALAADSWGDAFDLSGSSLLTLGFARADSAPGTALVFIEAAIGLVLLALLITYLPSIYAAFSRREAAVALLEVRAGSPFAPASAFELIRRAWVIHGLETMPEIWQRWERWFVELEESHTSIPALSFFRSPMPERHWVIAAGTVLDAAALMMSAVDDGRSPDASFCLRAGYLALGHIATFFRIPFDTSPAPTDPISVTRAEFDEMLARLEQAGVPLRADRDGAWRDFSGWRVNYDTVLVALAAFTVAPPAPWISDRLPVR